MFSAKKLMALGLILGALTLTGCHKKPCHKHEKEHSKIEKSKKHHKRHKKHSKKSKKSRLKEESRSKKGFFSK